MGTLRQRLARERQLQAEAHRTEAHEAKMEFPRPTPLSAAGLPPTFSHGARRRRRPTPEVTR